MGKKVSKKIAHTPAAAIKTGKKITKATTATQKPKLQKHSKKAPKVIKAKHQPTVTKAATPKIAKVNVPKPKALPKAAKPAKTAKPAKVPKVPSGPKGYSSD